MKKNFIEVTKQGVSFNFETLGTSEKLEIVFNRTLRIPDDNKKYGLPPGIGTFPVEHVEDYAKNLPELWAEHGGVFFPMYQAEAMWMAFRSSSGRPFAIKVASGKVNAVSGKAWKNELEGAVVHESELKARLMDKYNKQEPDYMVAPKQPWLDGFNVGKGVIRQFVAVPLQSGYTVEEQVTGKAEVGGIQIMVYPLKEEIWQAELKKREDEAKKYRGMAGAMSKGGGLEGAVFACASASSLSAAPRALRSAKPDMGLGAGGMMTQEIYADEYGVNAWDQSQGMRLFVHLANSEQYKEITGKNPPTLPPTPETYRRYNYPWFKYYDDGAVVEGSEILSKVDSIASMQEKNNEKILPDDGHKPNGPLIPLGTKTVKSGKW